MPSPSTVTRVAPTDFDWSSDHGPAAAVRRVVELSSAADGTAPLDEAALLALRHGRSTSPLWVAGAHGFAWLHDGGLHLVVAPPARGHGVGGALAAAATSVPGPLTAWSHGNHPAAALARRYGFDRVRDLWVMRRPLADLVSTPGDDGHEVDVRTFRVGEDEEAFLALNADAFAHHPEQGRMTRADLDERMAEPWFDPAGFFLASRDGRLVGFHWTKVHAATAQHPAYGEVYVVGVSATAQGGGLGRRLTLTGLQHLASLGLHEVMLYVEAENAPAIAVYRRLGFTHTAEDTHVQYARSSEDGR